MKKLLYIASICIASLFSACDDYLTVESPDQLTSSSFWRNQSDAEAGLAAAYSQLYLMTYSGDMWSSRKSNGRWKPIVKILSN